MKSQAITQEGMFEWDYIVRLNQTSMKGLEGKVSVHLDLFKALKSIINLLRLTLAHPCPHHQPTREAALCFSSPSDMPTEIVQRWICVSVEN